MGSTVRSSTPPYQQQMLSTGTLGWQSWPLVEHWKWSWLVPVGVLGIGGLVYVGSTSILLAGFSVIVLAFSVRSFLLPTKYEITSLGLRRLFARRIRIVPWQVIRAYQPRATGVLLFRHPEPAPIDVLRGMFVPYPDEADELLMALKLYLPHANEMQTTSG